MIDLKFIREQPDIVKANQVTRGADPHVVDDLLEADTHARATLAEFEQARSRQKDHGKSVAQAQGEDKNALLAEAKELAATVKQLQSLADAAGERVTELALMVGNLVQPGVPHGGEDDFVVVREVGEIPSLDNPRDHLDLGQALGAIDMERGAKVSGARFYFLTGVGAQLELALLQASMNLATESGFVPMITPTLVRPAIMGGTGYLGPHADEIYYLERDDLYLTGTSEVALAGYHSDEILDLTDGPRRYAGWSTCYRREAGSHGKDTRGIIRVHQFNKVELFSFCRQDDAVAEHERFLELEETMLQALGLPYRVIDSAAGDLGLSASRRYDCEAWLPSQQRWMEVTSTSNCTTFQARRLAIRERGDGGTVPVATINGTIGTTRWLVALLENHQRPDGGIDVPEVLRPYLGGRPVLEPM